MRLIPHCYAWSYVLVYLHILLVLNLSINATNYNIWRLNRIERILHKWKTKLASTIVISENWLTAEANTKHSVWTWLMHSHSYATLNASGTQHCKFDDCELRASLNLDNFYKCYIFSNFLKRRNFSSVSTWTCFHFHASTWLFSHLIA